MIRLTGHGADAAQQVTGILDATEAAVAASVSGHDLKSFGEWSQRSKRAMPDPVCFRAVLFDVGGPIDSELTRETLIDAHIRAAVERQGIAVTDDEYAAANDWAVLSFAPDAYAAIIWRLTGQNPDISRRVYRAFRERASERQMIEPRPGIPELLAALHRRGLLLGLAANQPPTILARLDDLGIGVYFQHREVSGIHGLRKPDTRVFLRACEDLRVSPSECIMVGDRIDNDIVPANVLGMRTILFRTGRHAKQQPRTWTEMPDVEVSSVNHLQGALSVMTVT